MPDTKYISLDKISQMIKNTSLSDDWKSELINTIYRMPTADVVEVVRCINCESCIKKIGENISVYLQCEKRLRTNDDEDFVFADDFCSYGQPKNGTNKLSLIDKINMITESELAEYKASERVLKKAFITLLVELENEKREYNAKMSYPSGTWYQRADETDNYVTSMYADRLSQAEQAIKVCVTNER